jgi:hypothetical protein
MAEIIHTLNFNSLSTGELGVSAAYGSFLSEAASCCLYFNRHPNPVLLSVTGDFPASATFQWSDVDESHSRTYSDLQEATEYGAYGMALVIAVKITGIPFVERSAKETGIDYWLGDGADERGIFQRTARLEVSGILRGNEKKITARLRTKIVQTKRSDETLLPAYAIIVEFAVPTARLTKRNANGRKP